MSQNKFTGNKDADRLILLALPPQDMLKFCSSSKYLDSICDEKFFFSKITDTPLEPLKNDKYKFYKYRNFYAIMMYYIAKLKEVFNYDYTFGDPKVQYNILKDSEIEDINETLREASRLGELSLVMYTLKNGADIHNADDLSLRLAVENGHLDIIKYLLENGADNDLVDNQELYMTAQNGHLEVIKFFHEKGYDLSELIGNSVFSGKLELVKYIMENSSILQERLNQALYIALVFGVDLEIVKYLVEHGANIKIKDQYLISKVKENPEVAKYLKL